jgi:hypothetical protein
MTGRIVPTPSACGPAAAAHGTVPAHQAGLPPVEADATPGRGHGKTLPLRQTGGHPVPGICRPIPGKRRSAPVSGIGRAGGSFNPQASRSLRREGSAPTGRNPPPRRSPLRGRSGDAKRFAPGTGLQRKHTAIHSSSFLLPPSTFQKAHSVGEAAGLKSSPWGQGSYRNAPPFNLPPSTFNLPKSPWHVSCNPHPHTTIGVNKPTPEEPVSGPAAP